MTAHGLTHADQCPNCDPDPDDGPPCCAVCCAQTDCDCESVADGEGIEPSSCGPHRTIELRGPKGKVWRP